MILSQGDCVSEPLHAQKTLDEEAWLMWGEIADDRPHLIGLELLLLETCVYVGLHVFAGWCARSELVDVHTLVHFNTSFTVLGAPPSGPLSLWSAN